MNLLVKKASALTTEEKTEKGITGIPSEWPVESYPYVDGDAVPSGFEVMTDSDLVQLKANHQASYDAWIASKTPIIVPPPTRPQNVDMVPLVEVALRKGLAGSANFTIVSPDFSDRTSWYQKSVEITNETLSTTDNLTYTGSKQHWINIDSEKLTVDYKKVLERDGTLSSQAKRRVLVKVDGVTQTSGYTIDFTAGSITFDSPQTGTVTASYWHNDGVTGRSEFLLTPPPGFAYRINHIECQFSRNSGFPKPILVEIWAGSVAVVNDKQTVNIAGYGGFSDLYFDLGYGQSRSTYRNLKDLINWCTNSYPTIPNCGELENDIMCFPFLYIIHPEISSKQGTLIRLRNVDDEPTEAEISTVTFYMEKVPV